MKYAVAVKPKIPAATPAHANFTWGRLPVSLIFVPDAHFHYENDSYRK
jgi:hypothetical protein